MNILSGLPIITLTPVAGGFGFQSKLISLARGARVILGSEKGEHKHDTRRVASPQNGWFAAKLVDDDAVGYVSPLPLSSAHAEIWASNGQVLIRDLDSAFGTYVNNTKITKETALKDGDIIHLGTPIPRNSKTPAYITDDHLKPVIARITVQ